MKHHIARTLLIAVAPVALSSIAWANDPGARDGLRQVEQYNSSIHGLAMFLDGFGFLMVFVRNYGYGAKAQLIGTVCTVVLAFVAGSVAGIVSRMTGAKSGANEDEGEFLAAQADASAE